MGEKHIRRINTMIATNDRVWTGGGDNIINVWSGEDGSLLRSLHTGHGHVFALISVGDAVWSAGREPDASIKRWNTSSMELIDTVEPMPHTDAICAMVLAGKMVWTSS